MITKEHYLELANKYGKFACWAIWADQGDKPKSNIGDISIFDIDINPDLLIQLNPNIIMVGLNFSRKIEKMVFVFFFDKSPQGQDYKIRHAFKNTRFYGAYMTDIIKDFEEKISGNVASRLKTNKEFEMQNIKLFEQELFDLKSRNPLIIAFGNHTYNILDRHFRNKYKIIKVPHYSNHISKEDYKLEVETILSSKD